MSRQGGDSYYVLVNSQDEIYSNDWGDTIDFNSWEEAEDELQELIAEERLTEQDGWHVERHRW